MQTVKHKMLGVGEVIGREEKDSGTYITVRFKNGRELKLAIPESFMNGTMEAEGSLKDEVDAIIAERKARVQATVERMEAAAATTSTPTARHGRIPKSTPTVKSTIEAAYEAYLISAGYRTETPSGHDSTVYSYSGAIRNHVLANEHITWEGLKDDIDNIVAKYDVGGLMKHIGAISNSTVINALKRFSEFVNA